jgi:diguanylate cyclase (GGDEF)-like protein
MVAEERVERHPEGVGACPSLSEGALERLSGSALFREVAQEALHEALQSAGELSLKSGGILLQAGQRYAAIYVLLAGRLALYQDEDARIPLQYVEPGECIGEIVLVDEEAPSPAVVAVVASRLLRLNRTDLWNLIEAQPKLARNLLRVLAARIGGGRSLGLPSQAQPLQHLVHTDPLTGLHNRRWMNEMFVRALDRCERARLPATLALIDLDRFRSINDNYGHRAGDRVLAQVAWVMLRQLRPADLVARCGGEEFAVLLPQTALSDAVAALERLRLAIGASHTALAERATVRISVSVGVAQWQQGWSLEELLHAAQGALEQAKQAGRNRVLTLEGGAAKSL